MSLIWVAFRFFIVSLGQRWGKGGGVPGRWGGLVCIEQQRGGVWAREIGTICPFGVFPLFYSNFWPNLSQKGLLHPPLTTFGDFPFWASPRSKVMFGCLALSVASGWP